MPFGDEISTKNSSVNEKTFCPAKSQNKRFLGFVGI